MEKDEKGINKHWKFILPEVVLCLSFEKEKILPREGAGITNRDVRKISAKVQVTWKDVAKPLREIHLV